jgi:hypothetical protein
VALPHALASITPPARLATAMQDLTRIIHAEYRVTVIVV